MRRNPGAWLRKQIRTRFVRHGLITMLSFGYISGAGIALWVVPLLGGKPWIVILLGTLLIGTMVVAMIRDKDRKDRGWRLQHMEKGADAEEAIGEMIDYVLTREGCAVAHHVEEIAQYGDIDHLVATPKGLWVIETKSDRIPHSEFARTLRQIKANVDSVQRWAPRATVQGCIVFGGRNKVSAKKKIYAVENVSIRCFANPSELMLQLRDEARSDARTSDLSGKVWELANIEATASQ